MRISPIFSKNQFPIITITIIIIIINHIWGPLRFFLNFLSLSQWVIYYSTFLQTSCYTVLPKKLNSSKNPPSCQYLNERGLVHCIMLLYFNNRMISYAQIIVLSWSSFYVSLYRITYFLILCSNYRSIVVFILRFLV